MGPPRPEYALLARWRSRRRRAKLSSERNYAASRCPVADDQGSFPNHRTTGGESNVGVSRCGVPRTDRPAVVLLRRRLASVDRPRIGRRAPLSSRRQKRLTAREWVVSSRLSLVPATDQRGCALSHSVAAAQSAESNVRERWEARLTRLSVPAAAGFALPVLRQSELRVESEWLEELDDVADGRLG
jgi:hypothetical protein